MNKATAAFEVLEQASSGDPAAKARVTQMLVGIAYDLQQKVDELSQQNDQEKLAPAAAALKTLLGRITDQSATADANTLIWLAEAFEKLAGVSAAAEKSPADGKLPPEVEANNRQAIKLYEQILARAKSEADFLPTEKAIAVRYRLAIVYRGLGDYDSATARLAEILKVKPTRLSVQIEAARTYQLRRRRRSAGVLHRGHSRGQRRDGADLGLGKARQSDLEGRQVPRHLPRSPVQHRPVPTVVRPIAAGYRQQEKEVAGTGQRQHPRDAAIRIDNGRRKVETKIRRPAARAANSSSINRRLVCTSSKTKRPKRPVAESKK